MDKIYIMQRTHQAQGTPYEQSEVADNRARPESPASPLTYGNDLLKRSLGLEGYYPAWLSFLVLALFSLAFFSLAAWIFNLSRRRS